MLPRATEANLVGSMLTNLLKANFGSTLPHLTELSRGALVMFTAKGLSVLVSLLMGVVVARLYGAYGAGIFFAALAVISLASAFSTLGLDAVMVRKIAAGAASSQWSRIQGLRRRGIILVVMGSVLTISILMIGAEIWRQIGSNRTDLLRAITIAILAILPVAIATLHAAMFRGLKKILEFQLFHANGLIIPACSLLLLLLFLRSSDVQMAVLAYSGGAFISAALAWYKWSCTVEKAPYEDVPASELLDSSLPLVWVTVFQTAIQWLPIVLLNIFASSAESGVYGVASRTAQITTMTLVLINSIAAPKFAELAAKGDWVTLERVARQATTLMILLALPIFVVLFFWSSFVLSIFGREFAVGGDVLKLLMLGQFVNVICGSVQLLLLMAGFERTVRNIFLLTAPVNFVLLVTLITFWSTYGAALAVTLSLFLSNVLMTIAVFRKLSIIIVPLPKAVFSRVLKKNGG